jgi:hypothetical protein
MTPPVASAAGTRVLPRGRAAQLPRAPRRVSGPAARPRRGEDARTRRPAAATDPFIFRVLRGTQQLADSRLLDRLIRGRLWIPLVAAGLMGIVFMQVSMLKLNAGIGRAVQSSSTLERQNAQLRADVSRLESGGRIVGAAHELGMVVPADGTTHYVTAAGRAQALDAARRMVPADQQALARAQAATAQTATAAAAAVGTTASAPPPAVATAASATPAAAAPPTATTSGTGAATAPTAATAPATGASTAPSTGAATTATQQQQQQQQPPPTATSGGAVAPAQG